MWARGRPSGMRRLSWAGAEKVTMRSTASSCSTGGGGGGLRCGFRGREAGGEEDEQLGLLALEVPGAEQLPQYGDRREKGDLLDLPCVLGVDQPGEHHRLSFGEGERGADPPREDAGDPLHRVGAV